MDRRKNNCKNPVIAVPIAALEILADLNDTADKVQVLHICEPFGAVGGFYQDFIQVVIIK